MKLSERRTERQHALHQMQYPRFHEAAHAIAEQRGVKDTSREGRYHNNRFKLIAEEVGLDVSRDADRGWSRTNLSAAAAAAYGYTLEQLEDVLAGRPGPDDRAAAAATSGPVCGCGNWTPTTPRCRRKMIVAGTVMCDACGEGVSPGRHRS